MKSIVALVLFGLFLSIGITSHAQTPDEETPAVEDVCDGQVGAAYGLCTAYCEAMDCDSDEPRATEKACARVATKFENITGEMLPCLLEGCDNPSNLGKPCDDGDACTQGEVCDENGACAGGFPICME